MDDIDSKESDRSGRRGWVDLDDDLNEDRGDSGQTGDTPPPRPGDFVIRLPGHGEEV